VQADDTDDYVQPERPEIVADVDYAAVIGLGPEAPDYVPAWYQDSYGAELKRSQVPVLAARVLTAHASGQF
jgi:hypothetical protein